MSFLAAFQRKLLKGDLLRERDFTLPELEGVAGVELDPGAEGGTDGNGERGRGRGRAGVVRRVRAGLRDKRCPDCESCRDERVEDEVGEKENNVIQSNKIILRGSKIQKHFSC